MVIIDFIFLYLRPSKRYLTGFLVYLSIVRSKNVNKALINKIPDNGAGKANYDNFDGTKWYMNFEF